MEITLLARSPYGNLAAVMDQPAVFAAILARVERSRRGSEMAVRLRQSLEVTDALWELAPVVVRASEAHQLRSPADVADEAGFGRPLSPQRREHLRRLGDTLQAAIDVALAEQPMDESLIAGLTPAAVSADPFGIANSLMGTPLYLERVMGQLGGSFTAQLEAMSVDDAGYLASYMWALDQSPRVPVLLRALFAAAVSTLEPLVTRLTIFNFGGYGCG